ncbi:MAG: hypothetical protein NTY38_33550, partial [Acidobacteria bacterium]|nr:hypothetical protein [Acidobacteriota bacterium]
DMLRLCSSLDENPAVVVTSAHADARLWVDAVDAGASDVLAQPFDRSEVCRVVRAAIEEQSISASA